MYTQHLAGRVLPLRIRVNSVSPGPVVTPLLPYFEKDSGPGALEWLNEQIGRPAQPDDLAEVVAWLLVGESGWVNGVALPVVGGMAAVRARVSMETARVRGSLETALGKGEMSSTHAPLASTITRSISFHGFLVARSMRTTSG